MKTLYNSFEDSMEDYIYFREVNDNLEGEVTLEGEVQAWDGKHHIVPETFNSFSEAFDRCMGRDCLDVTVRSDEGIFYVNVHHHDGINQFKITINR